MRKVRNALIALGLVVGSVAVLSAEPAQARPPRSCTVAIDEARQVARVMADMTQAVQDHLETIGAAARTGSVSTLISDLTESITTLGDTAEVLSVELRPHVTRFNSAAARCNAS